MHCIPETQNLQSMTISKLHQLPQIVFWQHPIRSAKNYRNSSATQKMKILKLVNALKAGDKSRSELLKLTEIHNTTLYAIISILKVSNCIEEKQDFDGQVKFGWCRGKDEKNFAFHQEYARLKEQAENLKHESKQLFVNLISKVLQ